MNSRCGGRLGQFRRRDLHRCGGRAVADGAGPSGAPSRASLAAAGGAGIVRERDPAARIGAAMHDRVRAGAGGLGAPFAADDFAAARWAAARPAPRCDRRPPRRRRRPGQPDDQDQTR
jgi:hypothetical protein